MKPFLFNDLFAVTTTLGVKSAGIDGVPAYVIDGFLQQPAEVRATLGATPAANWKHVEGGRNFVDYYDCRLRFPVSYPNAMLAVAQQAIQHLYKVETWPQHPQIDVNWFKQIKPKRADFAFPHHDLTGNAQQSFTCLVFVNSYEESSGGTAFFRFKPSGSLVADEAYQRAVQTHPRIVEGGGDYWLENAGEFWQRVGAVDMVPGRLLIFPSQYFHAADHPIDSYFEFPRMTVAFWMVK